MYVWILLADKPLYILSRLTLYDYTTTEIDITWAHKSGDADRLALQYRSGKYLTHTSNIFIRIDFKRQHTCSKIKILYHIVLVLKYLLIPQT